MDQTDNIDQDDGAAVPVDAMLLTEALAKLPNSVTLFGKTVSLQDLLQVAVNAGFDLQTGKGRNYSGAIEITSPALNGGESVNLYWEAE